MPLRSMTQPNSDKVFRTRLANGATLIVKEDPSAPVVSLNFWIEAGSVDEKPAERGMAHLIEHMIFKGTPKRGVGEISRQVEAAGGYLNAFTSFEHTCFYVVLPSSAIHKALEVEFDAYLNSTFDRGELEKEKEVVFEEMRMRRDDPWSWSWEMLFDLLFRKNPYHWPVIGDMDILGQVPRESLMGYYRKHYVPSNTVLTVVGDVSAPAILEWVRHHFERIRRPAPPARKFQEDPEPKSLRLRLEAGEVQQVYLSLGFPTLPISHPDAPAVEILEALLGDGSACRLNLAIREKSQSADEIGSDHFTGKYGGAFTFQALTDKRRLGDCLRQAMVEVGRLASNGATAEELAKVRTKVKASKIFEKQSVDGQAKTLGFWELQGGYELEEKFLQGLDSVSSADVQRVAERYLRPSRASLVLYHPKGDRIPGSASTWQKLLEKGLAEGKREKARRKAASLGVQKLRLRDGSTLLVKERRGLPLLSLGVFLKGGFQEESKSQEGITTLMAKCLLKGTRSKDHEKFSAEIEALAAHLDSSMEKDYWGLTMDVLKVNFGKALDLMLDSLYRPGFRDKEIVKEKKLQLAAIERIKDDPSELAMLHSDLLTFKGTPYAHAPMGSLKSLAPITPAAVRRWYRRALSPSKATWVAVGDFETLALRDLLNSRIPSLPRKTPSFPKALEVPVDPGTVRLENEGRQANLVLGLRAPRFASPDYFAFRVLHTVLSGMGGRLFEDLREKRSLAYSVYGSHDAGQLIGAYQIYIGCAPAKVEEARKGLLRVLDEVVEKGISAQEVERAKTYMIGLYQVGSQSNRAQVHSYARYELGGAQASWVEKFPDRVKAVRLKDVQMAAQKYFATDRKTWVLLVPKGSRQRSAGS